MRTHGWAVHPGRTLLLISIAVGIVLALVAVGALITPEIAPIIIAVGLLVEVALLTILYVVQVRRHW